MPKPNIPGPPPMPSMLAYTIQSTLASNWAPYVHVGFGSGSAGFRPQTPVDDSYWILILDSMDPKKKVKDFVVPGQNHTTVPAGLDTYMTNPQYIFAVVTQYLSMLHVPQGAFYDYLVKYGAGKALQRIEQINSVLGCGSYSRVSYILTGPCGPRSVGNISYEQGSTNTSELLLMSLMPMPDGKPPYSLCNSYTFKH